MKGRSIMKKKNKALLTLALAGTIALCGAGGLYVSMAKTMQEESTTQVEQKDDKFIEDVTTTIEAKSETLSEEDTKEPAVNQVWQEKEKIYLPECAKINDSDDYYCRIDWDGYDIKFFSGDFPGDYEETKEDLGLGKLMPILKNTVKKYSGNDFDKCEIDVSLTGPLNLEDAVYDSEKDCYVIESEDGTRCMIEYGERVLTKNHAEGEYDETIKRYQVSIYEDKHWYDIAVDSVTGEVLAFVHHDLTLDSYTKGWEKITEADHIPEYKITESEQKEFDSIIASFVSDELKLGNAEKIYGQNWELNFVGDTDYDMRAYYSAICKTEDGSMVEVVVDMGSKKIVSFNTTIKSYLSENLCNKVVKD